MTSALIEELKTVATKAKRSQMEDAVGSSWAALAAEEDPQGRGTGTLLVEAGEGGGGGEGRGGRGAGRGGGVGAGVLDSENNGRIRWQPSLTKEIELSQTNRGVGGVCVGVVPRIQSKLSRALHAHRGKKLLQDLQTQKSAATKRAMVRFRGAREKAAMAFVECLGFSQEDTMEGPLWRKTLGRSLGSHDATELVGGMWHGNGYRQETTYLHALSCTKTGWSSLIHNRVLHQALARPLRESKVQFVVEDTCPFRQKTPRHVGKHLADAVERKKKKYRGSFSAAYSLLPLAMSICGDVGSDVHALIKELAIRRVQHRSETYSNESQHLAEGTEVARLRRRFSFVLQQVLSFCTRHHLCRQGVALASTRKPHSQGPASVQAHRSGGTTGSEGQEGANRVGGGIRVGGGNGDGNGGVNGHGDGDGAGTGTGTGTWVGTRRRTTDGNGDRNGDGSEDCSGDENGDDGNGNRNDNRIEEGGREAKKRKKPQIVVDAVRETGETRVEREKNVEKEGLVQ